MVLAKVIGSVWATKKEDSLSGNKLLITRCFEPDTNKDLDIIIACDYIGAGIGDIVIITSGSGARKAQGDKEMLPIDAVIVGIVDQVDLNK
ncbi:EutN/CcmL family microcompartment protein [Brachyspira intermedia]|uniref:EutN/CcmL family microcompartment protein n=1 Tax=Brachyspira intermedia TaxID=84377 RepID=UPI003004E0E6